MHDLVRGIHKFQRSVFGSQRELFERLANQQRPDALFITCSDSRVNPNLLTQTEPGELFILRNAGNIVPPHTLHANGEAATIEYAIAALGIDDIIVCGHSRCGAMDALLNPDKLDELPAVRQWLAHAESTRRIVRANYGHLDEASRLMMAVEENTLVQLENVRTHPAVAAALVSGRLHLHAWVYEIETGEVVAFDAEQEKFVPITREVRAINEVRRRSPAVGSI